MAEFVIFFVLTCGQITDSVLYQNSSGKYWQGSPVALQQIIKKEGDPEDLISFIKVHNKVGVCI